MRSSTENEPKQQDLSLTSILYALSDDVRLQIVEHLAATAEIACGYFGIPMPKSSLSHHFRVLRTSGVIATRREGTALLNRLRTSDLDARFPGLLDSVLSARRHVDIASIVSSSPRLKADRPACAEPVSDQIDDIPALN